MAVFNLLVCNMYVGVNVHILTSFSFSFCCGPNCWSQKMRIKFFVQGYSEINYVPLI